jgi:hypothetical protein
MRQRGPWAFLDRQDVVFFFVEIVFVLDVADDLFQHVFDGDQAGHAAVFIDHDGHVVVVGAEVAQQHVQALGFGMKMAGRSMSRTSNDSSA